jgi:DNA mismatch repair protein MutL
VPDVVTIRQLAPEVADAIAAGEVVERPASVVKELVENALDAGAHSVTIEVDGAGQGRVVVVDDGVGIPAPELALALTRHATSKLASITDLGAIATLGFRGEALASIAAVARVELRSTVPGAPEGAVVRAEHLHSGDVEVAPPLVGTRVEVLGLFENTPARRAFLRKPATEAAAVVRVVAALGLCHPEVAFQLRVDGRRALDLRREQDLAARFGAIQRGAAAPLAVAGRREGIAVSGLVAEPAALRRSREHLYLAVNRRPVVSRSLAFAVEQAYRGLVEPGHFAVGALNLEVPADTIDINVHPTKREIRFREERKVFGVLQEACLAALAGSAAYAGSGLLRERAAEPYAPLAGAPGPAPEGFAQAVPPPPRQPAVAELRLPAIAVAANSAETGPADARIADATLGAVRLLRGPFRLVGQVLDSYIVAEGPSGLVLVDQHAAHERVMFNRLVAARDRGGRDIQPMLVPPVLHLTPIQAACLADVAPDLAAAGIVLEEFGPDAARLLAHEPMLPDRGLDRVVIEVLDSLVAEGREIDHARRLERATYTVACHSAIRFGQRLAREEMEGLLRDLEVADPGITCPHGRPTLLEIGEGQLRREFRRS